MTNGCLSKWVMIIEVPQAWVLHQRESGETSVRATFFTREQGIVQALCKGGRTPKKQALLQAFTPLWLSLSARRDSYYVQTLEMAEAPLPLVGKNLFVGLYVNELLYHVLRPHDPHPVLYDAYLTTLQTLLTSFERVAVEALLRRFEWVLLRDIGYVMSLTHDARSSRPIEAECYYQWIAGEGFVLADYGFLGAHLMAMANDQLEDAMVLRAAKRMMRLAIGQVLGGHEIKARQLYLR